MNRASFQTSRSLSSPVSSPFCFDSLSTFPISLSSSVAHPPSFSIRRSSDPSRSNASLSANPSPYRTMVHSAFVFSAARGLTPSSLSSSSHISSKCALISRPTTRRARFQMSTEENVTKTPTDTNTPQPTSTIEAPSFDTEVFSNFVDSATAKFEDFQQQVQEVDTDQLVEDAKEASMGLVDNLLAGDWLNRGELYGAIQIVFVILLLRGPGLLDGLVSFVTGPALLLLGAGVSGKALFDLGRKQLSIWPAPVPNGQLKTEGLYDLVRHPIYSGLILASAGFAVATGSPARLALSVAMAAFLIKKIEVEEKFLVEAYPEYEDYIESVPDKILPKIF